MEQLAEVGIDMDAVTQQLLDDGVKPFADSYDALIRGIAEKIDAFGSGYSKRQHFDTGAIIVPLDTPTASRDRHRYLAPRSRTSGSPETLRMQR